MHNELLSAAQSVSNIFILFSNFFKTFQQRVFFLIMFYICKCFVCLKTWLDKRNQFFKIVRCYLVTPISWREDLDASQWSAYLTMLRRMTRDDQQRSSSSSPLSSSSSVAANSNSITSLYTSRFVVLLFVVLFFFPLFIWISSSFFWVSISQRDIDETEHSVGLCWQTSRRSSRTRTNVDQRQTTLRAWSRIALLRRLHTSRYSRFHDCLFILWI